MHRIKEISIEITYDCALDCIFCSSSASHPPPIDNLPYDEITQVLTEAKELGAYEASFSGGEPLLHPDIDRILRFTSSLGYTILLYSSGVVFVNDDHRIPISVERFTNIKNITNGNIKIIFDFQADMAELADSLQGVDGVFKMCNESIANAISAGLSTEAHFIPMQPNYHHLINVMDYAEQLGLEQVSILRFVPQGRGEENRDKLLLTTSQNKELQRIFVQILDEIEHGQRTTELRLGHPVDFTFTTNGPRPIEACRGGTDAPLILPNGDVHMCPAWKSLPGVKAGNIKEQSLTEIWETSPFYIEFRHLISERFVEISGICHDCDHLIQCKGKCTAQRIKAHGREAPFPNCMYFGPDPLCPLIED